MSACSWLYCQEKTPKESVLTPTGFPFLAETWISNRASLLASRCLVCVALSLSLSRSLLSEGWTMAAGSAFFCYVKLLGIGDKTVCVNVCYDVHAWQKESLFVCMSWTTFWVWVCVRADFCMCVAEQQNPGCHSAAQLTVVARLNGSSVLP